MAQERLDIHKYIHVLIYTIAYTFLCMSTRRHISKTDVFPCNLIDSKIVTTVRGLCKQDTMIPTMPE